MKIDNFIKMNLFSNQIINGDAKLVLTKLKDYYLNEIKCIYIDPPYNNGDIYNHYNDKKSHEDWINELEIILINLKELLTKDGSLWISIDDKNMHYLKVLANKIFGFNNFIHTIVWQHRTTRENRNIFSNNHEYILIYSKCRDSFKKSRNKIINKNNNLSRFKNYDNDPRGPWQSVTAHVQDGHAVSSQFYEITAPNGKIHQLPKGRCWVYSKEKMKKEIQNNNIWFGKNGTGVPRIKYFKKKDSHLVTPETLWLSEDVGTTTKAKKHILKLLGKDDIVFDTPKPEELLNRILNIATNEGDIILDCFLGSGTTAATAHKMNRKYIGIEKNKNAAQYASSRITKVINGEDGGISKLVKWKGGNSFSSFIPFENLNKK